ncbi:MAG TPA: ribosome assembly factor SBDS [Nitrososphaeraceae archaeon]|nr:ribosome assembly factor SBDS [Nitrososphaeraceae archaeon]
MPETRVTIVRWVIEGNRFEILVKPDPALDYRMGRRNDLANVLISDEVYSDANKGSRASSDRLFRYFKTNDLGEVARQILLNGELSLTTEQRRKMVEEKKRQIVDYISKSFVDPKTHLPHPPLRIQSAMEDVRISIDPFKRAEEQVKSIIDALRKVLPLKSEILKLTVIIPASHSAQGYNAVKSLGNFKSDEWLADGSVRVTLEVNAGMKGRIIDKISSATRGAAQIKEDL